MEDSLCFSFALLTLIQHSKHAFRVFSVDFVMLCIALVTYRPLEVLDSKSNDPKIKKYQFINQNALFAFFICKGDPWSGDCIADSFTKVIVWRIQQEVEEEHISNHQINLRRFFMQRSQVQARCFHQWFSLICQVFDKQTLRGSPHDFPTFFLAYRNPVLLSSGCETNKMGQSAYVSVFRSRIERQEAPDACINIELSRGTELILGNHRTLAAQLQKAKKKVVSSFSGQGEIRGFELEQTSVIQLRNLRSGRGTHREGSGRFALFLKPSVAIHNRFSRTTSFELCSSSSFPHYRSDCSAVSFKRSRQLYGQHIARQYT